MGMFLRSTVCDFILTAVAAVSMCYVLLNGFYVDPDLQYSVIPAIGVIICVVALYFVTRSRRTSLIGGIIYGVALVIVWVISAAMIPNGWIFYDFEQNYLIFTMIIGLTATLYFLGSRSQLGVVITFVVGVFLLGLIQLFYQRFEIVWTVLFVLATIALLIYRNYQSSIRSSMGVEKVRFTPGFITSLIACAVSVGLAAVVWFAVIAPLNPEALDIKLITEYRALETKQVRGTSDLYQTPDLDITSDQLNDGTRTTDDIKEDVNGSPWPATGNMEQNPQEQENDSSMMGLNMDDLEEVFDLQSNPQNWPLYLILPIIILLIVLYFVLRRVRRNRRLAKFKELGSDGEYQKTYLFLLDRFRRLGVVVPPGQTMLEFADSSALAMRYQDGESGVAFADLTRCYSSMVYGKRAADEDHISKIERYYRSFWKAARKQLGNIRYFFKSFRL